MGKANFKDAKTLLLILLLFTLIISPYNHSFMVIFILVWISKNDIELRDILYLRKAKFPIVLLSMLIGALLALMLFFDHFYFQVAIENLSKSSMSFSPENIRFLFIASVFVPFIEELFFRGFLYNLYKKKGIVKALIISSLIFSVLHFDLYRVIIIFISGIFYALLYEITQCFWIPVLIHGSVNAIHTFILMKPVVKYMEVFLYWLHGDNVWIFRLKLLLISITLLILVILVTILIMRISKNNIFQEKKIKLFNKGDESY